MSRKKREKKQDSIQSLADKFYMTRSKEDFQNLYLRIYWGIKTYVSSKFLSNNIEDAEDVVAGVMEKVWTKIDMYDPMKANFSTWIYKIAMNDSLLFLKNRSKTSDRIVDIDISELYSATLLSGGSDNFVKQEECDYRIKDDLFEKLTYGEIIDNMYDVSISCINKLPDNYRLALREQLIHKKTIEQIAYDNDIKTTTLVNWLYKGKQALKEIIKNEFKELYENYTMGEENYLAL